MPKELGGKYAKVLPGLPKLPALDPSRQDQIDTYKREKILNRDPTVMAREYGKLRREKEQYEAALSALNIQIEAYEQLLVASQEANDAAWGKYGVQPNALRLDSGETVRVELKPYTNVADKEAFRLWCIANGYERKLQLWPATTNAIVNERLVAGEPEPDGCEVYAKPTVKFVRGGGE